MKQNENFIIAPLLKRGAENGTKTSEIIKKSSGIRTEREVRLIVKQERQRGALILADTQHGYYLPKDRAECERFVKTMRSRGISTLANITSISKALRESGYAEYKQLNLMDLLHDAENAGVV